MKIRCIIVDDEPLARQVLRSYIDKIPSLDLVKECGDAMQAAAYIHTHGVDLIFLDIKMPGMTGMDLLKSFESPPKVIITTAYSEYALQGYEYAVIDYLLKPIPFNRFLKAVNKALENDPVKKNIPVYHGEESAKEFVFLKEDKTEHKVRLSDIFFVEGWRNSVKVHIGDEVIMVSKTMADMEAILPGNAFIRIHKSFIVAIDKIARIHGSKVHLHDRSLPIGKYYKKDVQKMIDSHRLRDQE